MEIGDALSGIDHGQFRALLVAGVQIFDDLVLPGLRQRGDLVVQVHHAVVHVDAQLVEQLGVLLKSLLVENLHAVAEDNRVRDLHHRRLDVQREQHAGLVRILDFFFVEREQRLLAHEHGVDDLAVLQGDLGLEQEGFATLGQQLHLDVAGVIQRHRLLTVVEVAMVHVRDVAARGLAPLSHGMRIFAGVVLDRQWGAPVGVALTQHRVDRATQALGIARVD